MLAQRQALTFYQFTPIADLVGLREIFLGAGGELELVGTILLANEGINGTLIGGSGELGQMRDLIVEHCGDMPFKWSAVNEGNDGFFRFKVKLKREIVTFGVDDLDLSQRGEHVDADRFNELLADPEVVVIDTRNHYEIDIVLWS